MNEERTPENLAIDALNRHINKLIIKSDLYQAYMIGWGNGMFSLYEHIAVTESIEFADESFSFALDDDNEIYKYFREAVAIFKKELSSK